MYAWSFWRAGCTSCLVLDALPRLPAGPRGGQGFRSLCLGLSEALSAVAFLQKAYIRLGPDMGPGYLQGSDTTAYLCWWWGLLRVGGGDTVCPFRLPQPYPCTQVCQTQVEASMAEQEPTAEQLAQIAAENEEDEHSVNYKPPAQKSIQEIQELDKDDESLRKYKEALLGRVTVSAGKWAEAAPRRTPVTPGFLLPVPPSPMARQGWGGALTCSHSADPNVPNVVVTRLTLVCSTAPGPLELDLTGEWHH